MDSIGFFLRDLPLALHLKQGLLLSCLLEDISEQIRKGISHGSVSYWDEQGSYGGKDLVCLLYQGGLYGYKVRDEVLGCRDDLPVPAFACSNTLDIEILDSPDRFGVLLDYNARKYEQESMYRFGNIFCRICDHLLQNNPNTTAVGKIL